MSADLLRVVAFVLYFGILGQTVALAWGSLRWRRQAKESGIKKGSLLPYQVVVLGVLLFVADTMSIWQNFLRVGDPLTTYVIVNPILFTVTNIGLWLVMRYEWRKFAAQRLVWERAMTKNPPGAP